MKVTLELEFDSARVQQDAIDNNFKGPIAGYIKSLIAGAFDPVDVDITIKEVKLG